MKRLISKWIPLIALGVLLPFFAPGTAFAHCDSMDGPVVRDAQKALETGDINLVLIWVKSDAEAEIREAFEKTLEVRKLGQSARELADSYFFETLVRVHRAGEGAPYTGLKPTGTIIDPGLLAADKAIETGSVTELLKHLDKADHAEVTARFRQLQESCGFDSDNVEAGREYVEQYVIFIHYIEELFRVAQTGTSRHAGELESTHSPHTH